MFYFIFITNYRYLLNAVLFSVDKKSWGHSLHGQAAAVD
jgi:hypothetical protein